MSACLRPVLLVCLMTVLLWALPCWAQEETGGLLHPLFQDHAVLQRDQPVSVWGQAAAGERVSVRFADQTRSTHADPQGRWQLHLRAMPAGGPHTLVVRAGQRLQSVRDLQMGDVWLCAGQSNMELPVWRTLNASSEIAAATHPAIRLFTVPAAAAVTPRTSFPQDVAWKPASPDTVRDFSAACFYFARELQKTVNVPIGLIQAAWGGSRIESWTSAGALRTQPGMDFPLQVLALYGRDPEKAAALWGAHWQQWWRSRQDGVEADMPWQASLPTADWQTAPTQLGAWERWGDPALADYNGMVWYRTQVSLSAAQAARAASLELAPADETDITWVNGVAVGSQYGAGEPRRYPLSPGLLKTGINTVVVNVLDTYGDGGLSGPATAHALRFDDGSRVPLDAAWHYRVVGSSQAPPLAPWHAATGLATLYNGMIAPLGDYGLRGMVWYQGESNTADGRAYAAKLRGLRDDWRSQFGRQLPLLVVQLAGYGPPPQAPTESDWAQLREAQRQVVKEDPHAGLVVAIDIGDAYDIHPPNKQELGRRLARVARRVVYGAPGLATSGPTPVSASSTAGGLKVVFDNVAGQLLTTGANGPIGFELCDADVGHCQYAEATLGAADVVLRCPAAGCGARVRYCWANGPVCTLRDSSGAPAGPFEISVTGGEVQR